MRMANFEKHTQHRLYDFTDLKWERIRLPMHKPSLPESRSAAYMCTVRDATRYMTRPRGSWGDAAQRCPPWQNLKPWIRRVLLHAIDGMALSLGREHDGN